MHCSGENDMEMTDYEVKVYVAMLAYFAACVAGAYVYVFGWPL